MRTRLPEAWDEADAKEYLSLTRRMRVWLGRLRTLKRNRPLGPKSGVSWREIARRANVSAPYLHLALTRKISMAPDKVAAVVVAVAEATRGDA